MTSLSAGVAQVSAPGTSRPGGAVSNPNPAPSFVDREAWLLGRDDALGGLSWRLTPEDLLERAGALDVVSYMLGYRAGELERHKGGSDAL